MDFMSEWCVGVKRPLRILTMVDCCTREAMAIRASYSLPARRVVETLELLRQQGRKPKEIRVDNGPEFVSKVLANWCKRHEVRIQHIEPGKPTQNGHIESLNGKLRAECLNTHYFKDEEDAGRKIAAWHREYHQSRPHSALAGRTPAEAAASYGVRTPFASVMVVPAKPNRRPGDPAGSLRSALTAARLGQPSPNMRRRA
jgi:putative transposase